MITSIPKRGKMYFYHTYDTIPDKEAFEMHAHDGLEIYYFISGCAHYSVEGNRYELNPHDIMIMRQAETHKIEIDREEPYERIALHFSQSTFAEEKELLRPFFDRSLGKNNRFSADVFATGFYKSCLEEVKRLPHMADYYYKKAVLMSLLCELCKAFNGGFNMLNGLNDKDDIAVMMVNYVNANLFGEISLDIVAKHFYMSRSQVNRIFSRATGSTLWEYVIIKRLITARGQIKSGVTASKASAECGFRDYSAFYKAYKARYGHTPKDDYRK